MLTLLLVTLATIAAAIGVWSTHMIDGAWVFGTAEASLSLLVFIAGLMVFKKMSHKMCGCGKGCGCGMANCNCGGKCTMCGNEPCTCKK